MKHALFTLILLLSASSVVIAGDFEDGMKSSGTGFVVSRQGHILTNYHVVDGCTSIRVTTDGQKKELTIVGADAENDLAVLKLPAPALSVARFREGRIIRPGDSVVVVGFPLHGLLASEANVTTGTLSALAGIRNDTRFLQVTAPVQPGNSGGPLLDQSGNIVGVVESKLNALIIAKATGDIPQNINFAINGAVAKSFLDSHGVEYETRPSTKKVESAEIGAAAKKFTLLLECYPQKLDAELRALDADRRAVEAERRAAKEEQRRALEEARRIARDENVRAKLSQGHPDWETVVGPQGSQTPYRIWLATQPAEYQRIILDSEDPNVIGESIDRFKAETLSSQREAEREQAQAASERVLRFHEEEHAREAKKEAERQALNMEPQFLEEARRKGQEARARALRLEPEEPAQIAKEEAQQAATLPTVNSPEATLKGFRSGLSNPYWARVEAIIKSQWEAPPIANKGQSYTATVKFRLFRDGTIKDVEIQQTSGNSYFDISAQRAVLRPRALPPFPAEMTETYQDVAMVFRAGELVR
jgi:TonB family protein